jgi:antitoxin MazE
MRVHIQRWDNELALRVPKSFAVELNIDDGSVVEVSLDQGKIVIAPLNETDYSLEELLNGVTEHNLHAEIAAGEVT